MKAFLALAVLASSAVSMASDRAIYDIMYLPTAKTAYGISELNYVKTKVDFGSSDLNITGPIFIQTLGYSFSDKLSVNAALNYTNLEFDPDGSSKTETSGVSDPKFEARFRTLDTVHQWDILAGAIVGLGDAKTKSNGDSNNLQGGSSLYLGTQFGAKTTSLQWAVLGQITHNFKAKTEDKQNDVDVEDDANNSLLLRGDILNNISEMSKLRSFVSVDFAEGFDDDQDDDTAAATTFAIGTEYQHLISSNLMLRGGVDYNCIKQDTGSIDSFNTWIFRLGANYQF